MRHWVKYRLQNRIYFQVQHNRDISCFESCLAIFFLLFLAVESVQKCWRGKRQKILLNSPNSLGSAFKKNLRSTDQSRRWPGWRSVDPRIFYLLIGQKEQGMFQERHLVSQQKDQKSEQKLDTARQHMYKLLKMLQKWKILIQMNKIMPLYLGCPRN